MKKLVVVLMFTFLYYLGSITSQNIYPYAGTKQTGYNGDNGSALLAKMAFVHDVAADGFGNLYIADRDNHVIRKVDQAGIISTYAGTGIPGFSGDGGPATTAQLDSPWNVATDAAGNVYVADYVNCRIRKINTAGIISTVAGGGSVFPADGSAATSVFVNYPNAVAIDMSGNFYIIEYPNSTVRKVNTAGIISTIAGSNVPGFSGDGGIATSAKMNSPTGLAIDLSNNIYIADRGNNRIRKVNSSGIITTIAGTGADTSLGDGMPATNAQLATPWGIALDASGNIYVSELRSSKIRKINSLGIISTIAGTGVSGDSGDGGLATNAMLGSALGLDFDPLGNLYIPQVTRVREICYTSCVTGIAAIDKKDYVPLIFPNPNEGVFTLKCNYTVKNGLLIIYNAEGRDVFEQKIEIMETVIKASNLPAGFYTYQLFENACSIRQGKLVID